MRRGREDNEYESALAAEQRDLVLNSRRNIFITGGAGVGKTYFLREVIELLRSSHAHPNSLAITASTGVAALHIGGRTVHAWGGVGYGSLSAEQLEKNKSPALMRWRECSTLIIDEISMIGAHTFATLAELGAKVRGSDMRTVPFGGIRLIVCGDFCQLPAVRDRPCFTTKQWADCNFERVTLTKKHRQMCPDFGRILDGVRYGKLSNPDIDFLLKNSSKEPLPKAVRLCARVWDAWLYNCERLQQIDAPCAVYNALTHISETDESKIGALSTSKFDVQVEVKAGCRVMLVSNLDPARGLVNGMRGIVTRFDHSLLCEPMMDKTKSSFEIPVAPVVRFDNGVTEVMQPATAPEVCGEHMVGTRRQVPIVAAYAMTVHKSQGLTLEEVEIDCNGFFEGGQFYVALSRARELKNVHFVNPRELKSKVAIRGKGVDQYDK